MKCATARGLAILSLLTSVLPGFSEDAGEVAKGEALPNALVRSPDELARVKPLLEALPEGGRLRLEFETVSSAVTGYKDDVRYVRLATSLDPKGRPHGMELEFSDWYRKPIRVTPYTNGVKHGLERQYEDETVASETPWEKGVVQGVKRTFHPNGKPASESTFEKGVIVGQSRSYDADGRLIRVAHYEKGKRHGDQVDYWSEKPEAVQRVVPYRDDQVDGVAKAYYLSGKIKWERPFRNNKPHGVEKQYAEDGTVEKVLQWRDGNPAPEAGTQGP